jgi:hypothetical protein
MPVGSAMQLSSSPLHSSPGLHHPSQLQGVCPSLSRGWQVPSLFPGQNPATLQQNSPELQVPLLLHSNPSLPAQDWLSLEHPNASLATQITAFANARGDSEGNSLPKIR